MKKLTELDLQKAMDECAEIRFQSHGEWLAGMVKRLNAAIAEQPTKLKKPLLVVQTGNNIEPEVPCIS